MPLQTSIYWVFLQHFCGGGEGGERGLMIITLILSRIPILRILSSDLNTQFRKTKRMNQVHSLKFSKHRFLFEHCPRTQFSSLLKRFTKVFLPTRYVAVCPKSWQTHFFLCCSPSSIPKWHLQNGTMRNYTGGSPLHPLSLHDLLAFWKIHSSHPNTTSSLSGSLF